MRNQGNGHMWANTGKLAQALALACAVFLICVAAFSQANTGRILGTITDQTGGAIVGATVQVTDLGTNVTRTLTTDEAGAYNAPNLSPGTYKIDVTYMGFKSVERADTQLEVGKELRVDFSLQPGEQTQKITVTEALPLVETTNAVLGGTLQPGVIEDLPLNGRNFMNLLQLRPGITIFPGGGAWTQTTNGLRPEENVYLLDGITTIEIFSAQSTVNSVSLSGDAATVLPVDAIQEFNTQQNPKAEYGWKPGAIVDIALKAGTNNVHGTASAYGRTDALDARNPFQTNPDLPKQPVDLKEFGGTVGGPLKKDKIFFYASYEGQRYDVGNPVEQTFPTMAPGNILTPGNNTASVVQACLNNLAGINSGGAPRPNSPTSLALSGLNASCAPIPGAFTIFPNNPNAEAVYDFPTLFNTNTGLGKIDWHTNKSTFNAKFFSGEDTGSAVNSSNITQEYWVPNVSAYSYAIGADWTYTPSSAWVNDFRFGYTRFTQGFTTADCPGSPGAPSYPIALINNTPNCGMTPATITGFDGGIGCCGSFPKFYGPDTIFDFTESVSRLVGKHTFKWGGSFYHTISGAQGTYSNGRGSAPFGNSATGALEDFMAGVINTNNSKLLLGTPRRHETQDWFDAFFQDDWRLTQRLILNLGIRYEYVGSMKEEFNRLANFDIVNGFQQVGTSITQPWNPDTNNFAPRLGFAYDVRGDGKTVVRGGGTLIYVTPPLWTYLSQQNSTNPPTGLNTNPAGALLCTGPVDSTPGICSATPTPGETGTTPGTLASAAITLNNYGATTTGTAPNPAGQAAVGQVNWNECTGVGTSLLGPTTLCNGGGLYGGNIFPSSNTSGLLKCGTNRQCGAQSTDYNLKEAYVEQWSLGVQRAVTSNISLSVDYVGNHALKLLGQASLNDPPLGAGWTGTTNAAGSGSLNSCFSSFSGGATVNCKTNAAAQQAERPLVNSFPYMNYVWEVTNMNYSFYDGLQVALTQRNWHGFGYTAGYTWAHALDSGGTDRGGGLSPIVNDPQSAYGDGGFDIRQRFTFTANYVLPGRKGYGQMLEGWKVNGILNLQSPLPWDLAGGSTTNDPSGVREGGDRWLFYGDAGDFSGLGSNGVPFFSGNYTGADKLVYANTAANQAAHTPKSPLSPLPAACLSAASALNQSATNLTGLASLYNWGCYMDGSSILIPPALGTYGSLSPVTFRGNPIHLVDFSVLKNFRFNERLSGEARIEIFNLFNTTTYANPGNFNTSATNNPYTIGSNLGAALLSPDVANNNPQLGSGAARSIQLGFRLTF